MSRLVNGAVVKGIQILDDDEHEEEVKKSGTSRSLEDQSHIRVINRGYRVDKRHLQAHVIPSLFQALSSNKVEEVEESLRECNGLSVNTPNTYGFTPLFLASFDGNLSIVKLLLDYGANFNQTIPSGGSPLYAAASEGHSDVAMLLLEEGADVNHSLCDKRTALHAACIEGFTEVAHILFTAGADIHATDDDGCTSLNYAARNGNIQIIQLLVENGSDVNHPSRKTGFTPLHEVNSAGDVDSCVKLDVCQYLIDHQANINTKDNKGNNCLFVLVQTISSLYGTRRVELGDMKLLEFLIYNSADVNNASITKDTPLQECCYNGNLSTVQCLVENGAEINSYDHDKMTPLHYAADGGHFAISEYLIHNGAKINAIAEKGYTPLSLACNINDTMFEYRINSELVKFLIHKGAYVDARSDNGGTGLHVIIYRLLTIRIENGYDLLEAAKSFIDAGCHLDIPDKKKLSVLDYFAWVRSANIVPAHVDEVEELISHVAATLPLPLTCLTAKVVGRHKLLNSVDNEQVQKRLQPLIQLHMSAYGW